MTASLDLLRQTFETFRSKAAALYGEPSSWFHLRGIEDGGTHTEFDLQAQTGVIRIPLAYGEYDKSFKLCHEAFHFLGPVATAEVTYLEEGAASLFSYREHPAMLQDKAPEKYLRAIELVNKLGDDPHRCIARLRTLNKKISHVTPGEIRSAFPDVSQSDASALCDRFY